MATIAQERPRASYNPNVLRWARARRLITLEAAAKRAGTTEDKVQAWEDGRERPTIRQARKLAELYERPFLEFFGSQVPDVPASDLVPDFRMHRGMAAPEESLLLQDIQTWAETQRLNAFDLYQVLGYSLPDFPKEISFSLREPTENAAVRARAITGPSIDEQLGIKSNQRHNFPKTLRSCFERIGILVLKNNEIAKVKARGICVAARPLPVIVFGGEVASAQAFTLVHEFGHIGLNESAVSGPPGDAELGTQKRRVEDWCNSFAAAFLMPKDALEALVPPPPEPAPKISDGALSTLANRFSVSRHAMLIRLVELKYVEDRHYWHDRREQFIDEEENVRGGRSEYYGSRYRSAQGDLYTSLVMDAWSSGLITNHNAGEFMGIKNLEHLADIRQRFEG